MARAIPAARKEFHDAILQATEQRGSALYDCAMEIAQSISRRLLNQWLEEERPAAEAMYHESARRFVTLGNDFLKRVTESGDPFLPANFGGKDESKPTFGFKSPVDARFDFVKLHRRRAPPVRFANTTALQTGRPLPAPG